MIKLFPTGNVVSMLKQQNTYAGIEQLIQWMVAGATNEPTFSLLGGRLQKSKRARPEHGKGLELETSV